VDAYLQRIEAVNPKLNAVVQLTAMPPVRARPLSFYGKTLD
jgi:Asp-tRNA(Asn)/Glu-tRNA(Gln) amidotransferase A subunit family amidase